MANINLLSYSNTFGDWIITTNQLVQANNDFASNTFHKTTGTLFLDDPVLGLQVGNEIVSGKLQVQGVGSSAYIQNTLQVDGTMYANNFTVNNTFTLTGTTVFNSNTFTLNANNTVGANSTLSVNRGTYGANAAIRWNESAKYWDILDVTNSNYYKIITTENLVDNVISTSNTSVASANVANSLNNSIQSTISLAQAAFNKANTGVSNTSSIDNVARITANSAYTQANTATNNAASASSYANNGITLAQAAFNKANTGGGGGGSGIQSNSDATLNSLGVGSGISAPGNGGISLNGNVNFLGTGQRIYGPFSGGPVSNRVLWQSTFPSALNCSFGIMPPVGSGTSGTTNVLFHSGTEDPDNGPTLSVGAATSTVAITSGTLSGGGAVSTGNALPITFGVTPAGEVARFINNGSGKFLIGSSTDYGAKFQVSPPTPNPQVTGSGALAIQSVGGFGGGISLLDVGLPTEVAWGIWSQSGTLTFGSAYGRNTGLTPNASLDQSGNFSCTSLNQTSDYRLKENIQPITGALQKVTQLNPVTFNWKNDGRSSDGFIAHELQEVLPTSVIGTKDEVDDEGKPVYQHIDKSGLVATLTAAIQELNAKVVQLESKLKSAGIDGF